jgi:hypothetical protein
MDRKKNKKKGFVMIGKFLFQLALFCFVLLFLFIGGGFHKNNLQY